MSHRKTDGDTGPRKCEPSETLDSAKYKPICVHLVEALSVPLDTEFREGLDIPDTANTFVQGEIKTLSMDDWMKTSN